MRKVLFLGFTGLFVAAAVACATTSPDGSGINLPGRNDADTVGDGAIKDGPVSCEKVTAKVSDRPACDTCAKKQCCTEISACNASNDCTALQMCLAPCAQTDSFCILSCLEAHAKGGELLQEVGSCAQLKCKTDCPSETPDGDLFGDF